MSNADAQSLERDRLARAKAVFLDAIELAASERPAFVDAQCAHDQSLRALVLALIAGEDMPLAAEGLAQDIHLAALAATTAQLGGPPGDPLAGPLAGQLAGGPSARQTTIGRYRLIAPIGEGGFGVVYEAEQSEPVKRRVALKLIKLGMDTRQVVARFDAERQALALMDHPSIARVFDGGATDTGRPYFVMELVRGKSITHFSDESKLDIRARLQLFVQVCDAVQHAHSKGIIHRDLKPSNVLVTQSDGRALPKIIDFGIAKATSGTLTDRTVYTQARQMIGTPEYMSPEQANMAGLDIDTRTDVFSLGVILYELLAGATPHDGRRLRSASHGEAQRIISEEDPPRPSTKVSRHTENVTAVAASRRCDPHKLAASLRGELDWIAMKAMEKDRERRYDSASSLSADVTRYLAGEAVHAVPPSRLYQARKFVKRNSIMVAAASLAAAALLIGAAGFAWKARSARIERDTAIAERARAESTIDFMLSVLRSGDPASGIGGDNVTVVQAMDRAIADLNAGRFAADADTDARLRSAVADVIHPYSRDEDVAVLRQQAVDVLRRKYPEGHRALAVALSSLAYIHYAGAQFDIAEQLAAEALAMLESLRMHDSEEMIEVLSTVAIVRRAASADERIADFTRVYEMHRRRHPEDNPDVVAKMWNLGRSLSRAGRYEESDRILSEAVAMCRRLRLERSEILSHSIGILGILKLERGLYEEAERLAVESLDTYRLVVKAKTLNNAGKLLDLAHARLMVGKLAEAEAACEEALEYLHTRVHPRTATALSLRARCRHALGRVNEARADFDESIAVTKRLDIATSGRSLPEILYRSALARLDNNDIGTAIAELREAQEFAQRFLGPEQRIHGEINEALRRATLAPPHPDPPAPVQPLPPDRR